MDSVPLAPLVAAILTTVAGALFAGADTALTSLSSTRLAALIEQSTGSRRGAYERIQRDETTMRARYLIGRIVCNVATAVSLVVAFEPLGASAPWVGLVTAVVASGFFSELSTTLGKVHADRAAAFAALWLRPLELAVTPLASPLGWAASLVRKRGAVRPPDPRVAEAEVEIMVDEVEKSGLFGREPAEMIRNVLDFADRTVRDVMVPRGSVDALELSTPIDQVLETVSEGGHSRYPVYREQLDNVVGLLYAKDLFKAIEARRPKGTTLRDVIRSPANFVAESQPLSSMLREMRAKRQHLAIVVDELGGLSGIVTLEDVLEEIVGDIRDEHDPGEAPIQDLGDGRLVADAGVTMSDLSAYLGTSLPDAPEHDSLEGMLTAHLGHVPEVGTAISKFGLRFIVRDSDDKHIGKVEISRV
jgi:CBS domain containing-hemolysin-like protein